MDAGDWIEGVSLVSLWVCFMAGMFCWGARATGQRRFADIMYWAMVAAAAVVLGSFVAQWVRLILT